MESGLSQSSLSNEPPAVPGKSIPSNSFFSSYQAGFPLQDGGRARKGSVALVDDHCRCNFFFFFYHFGANVFQSFSMEPQKHPSTLPSDSQRTSSLYLIPRDLGNQGLHWLWTPTPKTESSRRSQQLHVSLRGPLGPGDNSCFIPKVPSPEPCARAAAERRRSLGLRRPSSRLPLPARRVRASLGLWLALAAPIWGPLAP